MSKADFSSKDCRKPTLLWPPASYSWPPAILFYRCCLDLLFRCLISEVVWPIIIKFRRDFFFFVLRFFGKYPAMDIRPLDRYCRSAMAQKLSSTGPGVFRRAERKETIDDFAQLCDLIAIISGTEEGIVNQKTALQTTVIPAQANLIWCTLVHKRLKIGPEF